VEGGVIGAGPTAAELRFLRALEQLDREKKPFSFRGLMAIAGYHSTTSVTCMLAQLKRRGFLVEGKRQVLEDGPVISAKAKKQLAHAA
jgi:hypothetical protein